MIVKQLSCDCFAGVRDMSVNFENGMNILLGANESGKSTLVDLLYHLFFKDTKLDARKDKTFMDLYFPKGTDMDGDTIDGTVKFETGKGAFTLHREWSGSGGSKLTPPNGIPTGNAKEIRKILDVELKYRRGIFDEVIFSSQKRQSALLAGLLDWKRDKKADSDAMQELSATINKAVLETGGVAIDRLEQKLVEKLNACAGRWDFSANTPEGGKARGLHNPWQKGRGTILDAYYQMEAAAQLLRQTEEIEKAIEEINGKLRDAKQQKREAADRRDRFSAYQTIISNRENLRALRHSEQTRLEAMEQAAQRWPALEEDRLRAARLKQALEQAAAYELFQAVAQLKEQLRQKQVRLEAIGAITAEQVRSAEVCTRRISTLEARIHGLNLAANLKLLGDTPVSVVSAVTGQPLDTGNGPFSITEAVEITVPGVMQLQLMPRGVDLDQVRAELVQTREQLTGIFEDSGVDSLEQLQAHFSEARSLRSDIESLNRQIETRLNGREWTALQAVPPSAESSAEIQKQLRALCGQQSVDSFLGQQIGQLRSYEAQYTSLDHLEGLMAQARGNLAAYTDKLSGIAEIPAEYQSITDADAHYAGLKAQMEAWDAALDDLNSQLGSTQLPPDSKSAEEYTEEHQRLKEKFEAELARYHHWKHIYEVFSRLKDQEMGDPTRDIQERFQEYLTALTEGGIRLNAMDDKLRSAMVSGNSRLTYGILSEGTKDTISLAFRLAMLEHLYPDGGAVAVFDDPFTDMDPQRTAQACRLLQRFAQRNQVLFITCDEKYTGLLSGNVIPMAKQ